MPGSGLGSWLSVVWSGCLVVRLFGVGLATARVQDRLIGLSAAWQLQCSGTQVVYDYPIVQVVYMFGFRFSFRCAQRKTN